MAETSPFSQRSSLQAAIRHSVKATRNRRMLCTLNANFLSCAGVCALTMLRCTQSQVQVCGLISPQTTPSPRPHALSITVSSTLPGNERREVLQLQGAVAEQTCERIERKRDASSNRRQLELNHHCHRWRRFADCRNKTLIRELQGSIASARL